MKKFLFLFVLTNLFALSSTDAGTLSSASDTAFHNNYTLDLFADVIYVDADATGNNNGTSWADAYNSLQDAIANAVSGDEIWVAKGTYIPSAYPENCTGCSTDRDFTFQLRDGISLYGGFAGNETQLSDRDIDANTSILSGDIGVPADNSDNAYHVVLAGFVNTTPTTRLDGFTLTAGNANGGISFITVNATNIARDSGGGIYTREGTNTLINNTLSGNEANLGGGIYTVFSASNLSNNTLSGNEASLGGGMFINHGTNTLTNNSLSGNWASNLGGGIFISGSTGVSTLTNNSLSGNTASGSGGIHLNVGTITLTNNIIWGNSDNTGNTSEIFNNSSTLDVSNSIIRGGFTGGTNIIDQDPLFVMPITVTAPTTTGDLRLQLASPAIDAGDNAAYQTATGIAPGSATDLDGNARLVGSAIDMGAYEYFTVCPPASILYVDASANGSNNGSSWADAFTDLQDALESNCTSITQIWVAAGTYKPSAYPENCSGCSSDRDFTFQLRDGISLYGGFAGNETQLTERDIDANTSTLSGDIGVVNNNEDNAYHLVVAAFSSTTPITWLDGFTVTGGNANSGSSITVNGVNLSSNRGGGIYTDEGTNMLTNNTLFGNSATENGGGIYTSLGQNTLTNNTLFGNEAQFGGGGIYTFLGMNMLSNNTLSGNLSTNGGGGIFMEQGLNTLTNSTLFGNTATNRGGGIFILQGTNILTNNTLSGNTAIEGGGIFTNGGTNTLTNNTLSGNTATNQGGGIQTELGTNTLTNNIIWGNSDGSGNASEIVNNLSTPTVSNSIIRGGFTGGAGIIDQDPLFVLPITVTAPTTTGDLRLQLGSPAIDAGNNADFQAATGTAPGSVTDIDGNARLVGSAIDMGAYENQILCPSTAILYVDASANGSNNGISWVDAFTDLQSALDSNCPGVTQIWVAAGIYKPSAYPEDCTGCATDRDFTFQLRDDVSLYGGFTGGETQLSDRDIEANTSILSGDIGVVNNNTDNVYHVVLAAFADDTPTTRLDGFTVTRGNANATSFATFITINGADLLSNRGGGIYTYGGTNILTNNTLFGNSTSNGGGGIYTFQGNNTLINNILTDNSTLGFGGGISLSSGTNTLTNNTLIENSSSNAGGGGIYTFQGNNTLMNNILTGNSALGFGGGISIGPGTNTLINNNLKGNTAGRGGGISIGGNSTNILTNNTLSGNSATDLGGGFYTSQATNTLSNNTLSGNTAVNDGGGIYTFQGNNTLTNNIIWGNSDNTGNTSEIFNNSSTVDVSNSIIRGGFTGGTNIIDQDPLFVMPITVTAPTTTGDLRLQLGSPAINAGSNAAYQNATGNDPASDTDIDGNPRLVGSAIDMGAYENQIVCPPASIFYVDASANGSNNGSSWDDAFTDLQDALESNCPGVTEIWVAAGIYKPSAYPENCSGCTTNRDFTFQLRDGISLYGGFAGGEIQLSDRNIDANASILSGDIGVVNNNTDNVYHVVLASFANATPTTWLDGFTVTGGNANGSSSITVNVSSVFRDNGGGIFITGGTNTLINNTLSGNSTTISGGGIYTLFSTNTLSNNTLSGNEAGFAGGIYTFFGTNTLTNNTLSGNLATNLGGGIFINGGTNTLTNNTLSGNTATNQGGGIYSFQSTNTLTNNIIWGNSDGSGNASELFNDASTLNVSNSVIRGGFTGGADIIDQNPLFVSPITAAAPTTTGDLRLQLASPAIDAGDNAAYQTATGIAPGSATDIDGNARLIGSTIDIGAYENFDACPSTAILYVNASAAGNNNGDSWADAFTDLQSALEVSNCPNVTQIWVAAGTYKPSAYPENCTNCSTNRDFTFQLRDGISLYGGFAGNETQLSDRDIDTNTSILSGDIGAVSDNSDNVHHVVLAAFADTTPTTRLDGFTITAGNANVNTSMSVNGISLSRSRGGGILTNQGENTLINNRLSGNTADFGGGINTVQGTNTLVNNEVSGNTSNNFGGGINILAGTNTLTNNTISGNTAGIGGAGIFSSSATNTLINNTVSGNIANTTGGGILISGGTNTLTNSIVWNNVDQNGVSEIVGSSISVSNSIIQGGFTGTNNINQDPLFVTPITAAAPTTTGDLRLRLGSPAIDAGDNAAYQTATGTALGSATDLDGNARLVGSTIDMGAYENQIVCPPTSILYVDASVTGGNNGSSWGDAFTDLQSALLASNCPGVTQIWVAAGTYKPSAYPENCTGCSTDRDFTFQLRDGISLYGGFAGGETQLSERDIDANASILSGDIGIVNNNTDNVHHVVIASFAGTTPTTRLDGFTLTAGNANGGNSFITVNGVNILRGTGGGIHAFGGTNTLVNNTVSGNTAISGGGIDLRYGPNTLTNNTLSGNSATNFGGGIVTSNSTSTLTNNTVSGNTANSGGGISTFAGTITLTNNIIWGNTNGSGSPSEVFLGFGATLIVSNSIIRGGYTGAGNLDQDPLFVTPITAAAPTTTGDLRLQLGSPAINAGDNSAYQTATGNNPASDTDIDGNPRLFQNTIDLGAYEVDFNQSQWRGTVSEDWENSANWDEGVPDDQSVALIRDISQNTPRILAPTNAEVSHLFIAENAALNVNGVLKSIQGIDNNGQIAFKSDATGTAQFDEFTGTISGSGEVRVERYIPAGLPDLRRAFRFLTSSVNSQSSINANWQEGATTEDTTPNPNSGYGTHITGGSASLGFDQNGSGTASVFTFDNTNQNATATQDDDWYALPNTNIKTLKAGEAYLTFIRGDRSIDVTSNSATPTNTTLRASGSLHIGPREFSSANNSITPEYGLSDQADFYSLVGNPYQAIVDINNLDFTNVKSNFYWVWDANLGSQGQYTTVSLPSGLNTTTSSANQFVQPGQSFFVQTIADGAASLTFNEDDKNTSGGATTIFSEQNEPSIQLLLYTTNAFNTSAKESDGTLINFSDNANNGLDLFDADKFLGPGENLARLHSNELISIENRGMPTDNETLPLSTTGYTGDNYTFVVNASNIQSNFEAYLLDNYTGTQTQLNEGATQINFSVDANIPSSSASDRFSLVFDNTTLGVDENTFGADFSLYPNPTRDGRFSIKTQGLSGKDVNIKIHNILGQQVLNQNFKVKNNGDVNMEASGLSSGVYVVELIENEKSFTAKLIVE